MARTINRLSDRTVRTVTTPGLHADGGNLFLVVDQPRIQAGQALGVRVSVGRQAEGNGSRWSQLRYPCRGP